MTFRTICVVSDDLDRIRPLTHVSSISIDQVDTLGPLFKNRELAALVIDLPSYDPARRQRLLTELRTYVQTTPIDTRIPLLLHTSDPEPLDDLLTEERVHHAPNLGARVFEHQLETLGICQQTKGFSR